MDCPNCQELFSEYADCTLEASLLPRLEAHLAECQDCAAEWKYFAQTLAWLKRMHVAAPEGLMEDIHAKLGTTSGHLHPLTRLVSFFKKGDFSFSMPAAAATLASAAVVMLLVKNFASPDFLSLLGVSSQPAVVQQTQPSKPLARQYAASQAESFLQQNKPRFTVPSITDLDSSLALRQLDLRMVTAGNSDPFDVLGPVDHPSAFPGDLSSHQFHSFILGHFPPDVKILLNRVSTADRLSLYRKLLNGDSWSAKIINRNTLLLYIDPYDLKNLRALLADYAPDVSPAAASDSSFGSPKRVLTVLLRL